MKRIAVSTVAAAVLLAASAAAGQALGVGHTGGISFSAPPPAPPPPPQPSPVTPIQPAPQPPGDLFRAAPDTYAPKYDRLTPQPLFFPYALPGYPYVTYEPRRDDRDRRRERDSDRDRDRERADTPAAPPAPAAAPSSTPPAPVVLAAPRAYYVIPRCYAGDTPPRADQLRPGCSLQNLRRIDPR
jgi:hypothetical protein